MDPREVKCEDCDETRMARRKDGRTVPFRENCPICNSTDFVDLAEER
jgi:Zn finger protein HypA/HybF involved in hydrogenase expression